MSSKRIPVFPFVLFAVLGGLGLWFFVSGCKEDPIVPPAPDPEKPAALEYKSWEKPAAVLVLTGEQRGYIEPCGCSETQSGGLARRADLIHGLLKRGWPVAGLDLGGSLRMAKNEAGATGRSGQLLNKLQSRLKFDTMLKVLEDLRYSAVVMGHEELLFEGGSLLNNFTPQLAPESGDVHPVLLAANVLIFGEPSLGPNRSQTVKVGQVKIGVTAVVGHKHFGDYPPADIEIKPPAEVLPEMVKTLKEQNTDFNVLLSHADFKETEELLKQFPDFKVAMCLSSAEDGSEEPQQVGESLVLQVGRKGKHVGVLAYYPDEEPKFRFELVELTNKQFKNDPAVEPHLLAYQDQLKEHSNSVVEDPHGGKHDRDPNSYLYSSENMYSGFHPKSGEFVGAAKCGECHTKAYAKWKESKHAHAYDSLKTGREGQYSKPIPRTHDPECLSCHVTGWSPQGVFPYPSGFLPEVVANHESEPDRYVKLQGQQCENCHGPGSEHVAIEWAAKEKPGSIEQEKLRESRRQMVLSKTAAEQNLCIKCHDYENSPKFQFDEYWKKVEHPWRD